MGALLEQAKPTKPTFFTNLPPKLPSKWRTSAASLSTCTSPASAARPTASSRPRTTAACRSALPRSTRTAATRARTRCTRCAASCAPWGERRLHEPPDPARRLPQERLERERKLECFFLGQVL